MLLDSSKCFSPISSCHSDNGVVNLDVNDSLVDSNFSYASCVTSEKQESFSNILNIHHCRVQAIQKKHGNKISKDYFYFDAFAGSGVYKDSLTGDLHVGSPILFLDRMCLTQQSFKAVFTDRDESSMLNLKRICRDRYSLDILKNCFFVVDSWEKMLPDIKNYLITVDKPQFGLLYFDPNGLLNWKFLSEELRDPAFSKVDILLNLNNSAAKRVRGRDLAKITKSKNSDNTLLSIGDGAVQDEWKTWTTREGLGRIPKSNFCLSEVRGNWQFTQVLLSNWPKAVQGYSSLGFVDSKTLEGERRLLKISLTRDEYKAFLKESFNVN